MAESPSKTGMGSSKKKKKKKKQAVLAVLTGQDLVQVSSAHAAPLLFVQGCENVQIGTVNSQQVHTPQGDSACAETVTSTTKNGAGLIVVKDILALSTQAMPLTELEKQLQIKLRDAGVKTFRELAGLQLLDFLTANKNVFDLFNRKQKKYVKCRTVVRKNLETEFLKGEVCAQGKCSRAREFPVAESTAFQPVTHHEEFEDASDTGENYSSSWTVVKRKQRRSGNAPSTDGNLVRPVSKNRQFELMKFKTLISMPAGDDLLFVPSSTVYEKNEKQFMIDVVCLWNTPDRECSYIVVGINAGKLCGTEKSLENNIYQKLFPNEYFTTTPSFECFSLYFNSMLFNIVVVPSSHGHTVPCIVKTDISMNGRYVRTGQLWCRVGNKNTICQPTDPLFGNIYGWFLHQYHDHETPEKKNGQATTSEQPKGQAVDDETCTDNRSVSSNPFDLFWNSLNGFKRGHFALVSGDIKSHTKHLNALALLPWIAVYDFDVFSYSSGLLNALQDPIEDQRHLRIRTWKDQAENISEQGTLWCCLRGRREMSETRTDQKDGNIEDKNAWYREVGKGLACNCEKLACFIEDYTVLNLVVLWPRNENLIPFFCKFLDRLNESLASAPNIVVCLNNSPVTEIGKSRFKTLCADFETSLQVCCCPFEELFAGIINNVSQEKGKDILYEFPKAKGHNVSPITAKDASWLREDFDILYLDNPYKTTEDKEMQIQEDMNNFYKGDTLHWSSWYLFGSEQVDIERSVMKQLEDQIHSHIDEYKTSITVLFHSPGSGGTTLAQRILWKFHNKIPSVHLKLRSPSSLDELDRKILFVHDKTDLPVLLMIDGEEESKVRCLARVLKYTIILYVKRYPYKIPSENKRDRVFLSGTVSPEEAGRLALKFGGRCDDRKRNTLKKLSKDVQTKKTNHYLYEFGMTLHLHEFKGIVSHVKGYLQLEKNPTRELTPWQKCLGYLALVYFYGQLSLPCQFFAALFNQAPNYLMSLEEDFPHPIPYFVVYDKNESRKNNLRICQHIVAKEILEQLLSRHAKSFSKDRTDALGLSACRNLSNFCIDFIEYASMRKTKNAITASAVCFILTKTFIFRDEKDISENDQKVRRRPVLSKLMNDIQGGKPLFTDRLKVLEKLSSSFPDNPNYHAHLGRFHAFCRPDAENEAERCFQKAIDLCEEQRDGKRDEDLAEGLKLSMMHIYHMYGIKKQRDVSMFTGKSHEERNNSFADDRFFLEQIKELVKIAIVACDYFTKSREITPHTYSLCISAYTGEIQVRLLICDFVKRHFKHELENSILEFLSSEADTRSKEFVQISISAIENLVLECYMDVELVTDDVDALRKQVRWYNSLFRKQVLPIDSMASEDCVSARRQQIAAKKLKFGTANNLNGIESIDNVGDLMEVVQLYEQNFHDIIIHGFQGSVSKKELDRDYRDWIYAIRHEQFCKEYSVEEVLTHVRNWYDLVHSPISTFYLFVVTSLLGFGTENVPGKTEYLFGALDMKTELARMNRLIIRAKYPREWLGNCSPGIKRLVSGNRYVGVCSEERGGASTMRAGLAACKGTICPPNTSKVSGFIDLDLEVETVKVYYIPTIVGLEGNRYVGQRVEFNLAFSVQHGFEAFNVKLLKRHACPVCNAKIEFTSAEATNRCRCGYAVSKDDMNEVH